MAATSTDRSALAVRRSVVGVVATLLTLAASPGAAHAAAPFGEQAFRAVAARAAEGHLLRGPALEPHLLRAWAAATNGLLDRVRPEVEVMPSAFLAAALVDPERVARYSGATAPIRCKRRVVEGLVLHRKPSAPAAQAVQAREDPLVEALKVWPVDVGRSVGEATRRLPPQGEALFACVRRALARGRLLPTAWRAADQAPSERRAKPAWRQAAAWMLRALDAHSRLEEAEVWQALNAAETSVADLGLTLRWADGRASIRTVDAEGAAGGSGLAAGDVLLKIDERDATALSQAQIAAALDRPIGAQVRLGVARAAGPCLDVALTYGASRHVDVQVERISPGLAVARVEKFAPGGAARLRAGLARAAEAGPLGAVVLDMRDNGGGILPEALAFAAVFLGGGDGLTVQTRDDRVTLPLEGEGEPAWGPPRDERPLVVLINRGCASSCELLAAALRDRGRAVLVGGRSFGKATLQERFELPGTSDGMMLTVAMFASPTNRPVQAVGVEPHLTLGRQLGLRGAAAGEAKMPFHLVDAGAQRGGDRSALSARERRCLKRFSMPPNGADPWKSAALAIAGCLAGPAP